MEGGQRFTATRTWALADWVSTHSWEQAEIATSGSTHLQNQDGSPIRPGHSVLSSAWFGTPNSKSCQPWILFCHLAWAGKLVYSLPIAEYPMTPLNQEGWLEHLGSSLSHPYWSRELWEHFFCPSAETSWQTCLAWELGMQFCLIHIPKNKPY